MICILQLHLKGLYICQAEVELSDNSYDVTWDQSCQIREIQLQAAIEVFRVTHLRKILKANYTDQVVVFFKSKMNVYEPGEFSNEYSSSAGDEKGNGSVDGQNLQ